MLEESTGATEGKLKVTHVNVKYARPMAFSGTDQRPRLYWLVIRQWGVDVRRERSRARRGIA